MKNKIFSRGLYIEGLRQLRLSGIIIFILATVINLLTPIGSLIDYNHIVLNSDSVIQPHIMGLNEIAPTIFYIATLVAPVLTFILFGSFNRRNASDFYHSLPYTRLCIFISFSAAVFTWLFAIELISSLIPLIFCAVLPDIFILSFVGLFDILLTLLACSLIIVFSVICGMSTSGTVLANIVTSGLFMFLPRFIIFIITFPLGSITPIIEGHYGIFSTQYNVLVNLILTIFDMSGTYDDIYIGNIKHDIYSLFIALIYIVLAALLFIRRKSETAGNAAGGKKAQSAVRISIGFVLSSIATVVMLSGNAYLDEIWPLYLFAIIAYFVYEAITGKTLKKLYRAAPGLAIVLLLNLTIIGISLTGRTIVHSYTPSPSEVSSIYLVSSDNSSNYYYDDITFNDYATKNASKIKIENERAIELVTKALNANNKRSIEGNFHSFRWEEIKNEYDDYYKYEEIRYIYITVRYVSEGGISRYRNIYMSDEEYNELTSEISKIDAYREWYTKIPDALDRTINIVSQKHNYIKYNFDNETNQKLLDILRKEIEEIDLAEWISHVSAYSSSGIYNITYRPVNMQSDLIIPFDEGILPKTTEAIFEYASKMHRDKASKFPEFLEDLLTEDFESDKYNYFYMSIQAFDGDAVWSLNLRDYNIYELKLLLEDPSNDINTSLSYDEAEKLIQKLNELITVLKDTKNNELNSNRYLSVQINGNLSENNKYTEEVFYLPYPDGFTPERISHLFSLYQTSEAETSKIIVD